MVIFWSCVCRLFLRRLIFWFDFWFIELSNSAGKIQATADELWVKPHVESLRSDFWRRTSTAVDNLGERVALGRTRCAVWFHEM